MTPAELLAKHPYPAEYASARRLDFMWQLDLALPPDKLWPIIADTSRMNRALGRGEMQFEPRDGRMRGQAIVGGLRHDWLEVPWNWAAGQWLESLRLYERGYPRVIYTVFLLDPEGAGTRLTSYFGVVPRGPLARFALRMGFATLEKDYQRILPRVVDELAKGQTPLVISVENGLAEGAAARVARLREQLHARGLDRAVVDKLVDWIATGDEQDLYRIQVRERARAWGFDEDELLRTALHATRLGLLDLSWDVVCPHCRGVTEEEGSLGKVPTLGECPVCGIDFATDSAEAIEITFHVHPSIRTIPKRMFCSAEPAQKAHIRLVKELLPGGELATTPTLAAGRYRMRLEGEKRYGYLDVAPARGEPELLWRASDPPAERSSAAAPVLRLVNDTGDPRRFVVETAQWVDIALRPRRLLSFQDFRDLFAEEYLGADVQLGIGEQTILFTDIVGSTAMYAQKGDPAAFTAVKKHFNEVFAIVRGHRGAVVKTIGDAAMAAFNDPLDAVRAAHALHQRFPPGSDTRLRISLNTGPCIAVQLNTAIDYFGHTVNIAAKLQGLAESWQVAMSAATHDAPGVAAWLADNGVELEEAEYASAALTRPVAAKRWTVFNGT